MRPFEFWEEIIKEVDINGDGEFEFDEFLRMIYKKFVILELIILSF